MTWLRTHALVALASATFMVVSARLVAALEAEAGIARLQIDPANT